MKLFDLLDNRSNVIDLSGFIFVSLSVDDVSGQSQTARSLYIFSCLRSIFLTLPLPGNSSVNLKIFRINNIGNKSR